jgi:MATE family multidrug resistance protein
MDNAARSSSHGPSQKSEIRSMVGLALPVVTVQVGMMTMGVVDTLMVGRVSPVALAAVALGNLYFISLAIFGIGVVAVLDPIIAQAVGARDRIAISRGLQRGLVIAAALSVSTSLLLAPGEYFLTFLRQPADVVPVAADYARACIPGVFPFLAFAVLRQVLQAVGVVKPIVLIIVVSNLANVGLNWVLIFGHLGFPRLGAVGSAWATSFCRFLMAAGLLAFGWNELRQHLVPLRRDTFIVDSLKRMLRLGLPIGFQLQLELGSFAVAALLIGWLGTYAMGAHQIAINLASLTYMVPLGVSAAAAVRVGYAVGRGDPPGARRSAAAALACGGAFMLLAGILFFAVPGGLARLYTEESAVIAIASTLIPIAGFFQVFDGLQIVAAGVLRGLGDTRAPLVINLFGFWLIGLPVSVFLAFVAGAGPAGIWWGFVAGLGSVAVFLLGRVRFRLRREMRRIVVDSGKELKEATPKTT